MGELITKSVYYVKAAITDHNGSISVSSWSVKGIELFLRLHSVCKAKV